MRVESSTEIIKKLKAEGYYLDRIKGSHHQFKHPEKHKTVTVQHPKKDIYGNTLKSIYRQADWKW